MCTHLIVTTADFAVHLPIMFTITTRFETILMFYISGRVWVTIWMYTCKWLTVMDFIREDLVSVKTPFVTLKWYILTSSPSGLLHPIAGPSGLLHMLGFNKKNYIIKIWNGMRRNGIQHHVPLMTLIFILLNLYFIKCSYSTNFNLF